MSARRNMNGAQVSALAMLGLSWIGGALGALLSLIAYCALGYFTIRLYLAAQEPIR